VPVAWLLCTVTKDVVCPDDLDTELMGSIRRLWRQAMARVFP